MLLLAPEGFWKCLTNLAVRCWRLLLLLCVLEFSVQVLEHVLVTFPRVHDFLERAKRATGQQTPSGTRPPTRVTSFNPNSVSLQVPGIPSAFTEDPLQHCLYFQGEMVGESVKY